MRYQKSPAWIAQEVFEGEAAILVPVLAEGIDLTQMLRLNPTAIHILNRLETPQTLSSVVSSVIEEFGDENTSVPEIETHVKRFIEELIDLKAVNPAP